MVALKRRAAERGTSLSALATALLQRGLDERPSTAAEYVPNFPVFKGTGPALVDISDREALYNVLGADRDAPIRDPTRGAARRPRRALNVFVVDTNLLIYAAMFDAPQHERARSWLAACARGDRPWHTVALMREHGVREIHTADKDFHRFRELRVVNPLAA